MSYDKRLPKAWEAINKNKSDISTKRSLSDKSFTEGITLPNGQEISFNYRDINKGLGNIYKGKFEGQDIRNFYFYTTDIDGSNGYSSLIFDTSNSPISKNGTGWAKFANGLIVQWGRFTFSNPAAPLNIFFPISFTQAYSASYVFDGMNTSDRLININMYNLNMYTSYMRTMSNCAGGTQVSWFAIGY